MNKFFTIFHTIRHLRPIQVRYQLWYRFRRAGGQRHGYYYSSTQNCRIYPVVLQEYLPKYTSFDNGSFTFLHQSVTFKENEIDWNYNRFGKLWTYNLNYFDFLLQPQMQTETAGRLIKDFILQLNEGACALEPYPTALRGINWIKFLSKSPLPDQQDISDSLYAQYQTLADNLEYHLLGNHLLEDGFSLLFGAYYFKDESLYQKAVTIIEPELKEQILKDGAHFELSPMYHQIILDRLLDSINLVQNNQRFHDQDILHHFMKEKALKMLQWLNFMTFSDGSIPLLNDSASGIAPTTDQLNRYAIRLGIFEENIIHVIRNNSCNSYLKDSGYRRFNGANFECILDIGQVGPSYQPGHAHADTFNFVLNIHNQPCMVDTGISTYEANATRLKERGTSSHNTVTLKDENSSKVWSSFRVAQRARVTILKEDPHCVIARHDGYRSMNTIHQREWTFQDDHILIADRLTGKITEGKAHLWLSSSIIPKVRNNSIELNGASVAFENASQVSVISTKLPEGYNQYTDAYTIEITFTNYLYTILSIDQSIN